MADGGVSNNNFSRFQVFTGGVPSNIANFGYTADEVKIQSGEPEKDVRIAPMAAPAVTESRLALLRGGSDLSRLASPADPGFNPFEGPKLMLQLNRDALTKLRSPILGQVAGIVDELKDTGDPIAHRMNDSIRKHVLSMTKVVGSLVDMASFVRANQAQGLS